MLRLTHRLECIADAEARRQAPRRVVFKGIDEISDNALRRNQQVDAPEHPVSIVIGGVRQLCLLKGILPQIGDSRDAMRLVFSVPDIEAVALLRQERDLPFVVAEGRKVAIVGDVEKLFTRAWPFT